MFWSQLKSSKSDFNHLIFCNYPPKSTISQTMTMVLLYNLRKYSIHYIVNKSHLMNVVSCILTKYRSDSLQWKLILSFISYNRNWSKEWLKECLQTVPRTVSSLKARISRSCWVGTHKPANGNADWPSREICCSPQRMTALTNSVVVIKKYIKNLKTFSFCKRTIVIILLFERLKQRLNCEFVFWITNNR